MGWQFPSGCSASTGEDAKARSLGLQSQLWRGVCVTISAFLNLCDHFCSDTSHSYLLHTLPQSQSPCSSDQSLLACALHLKVALHGSFQSSSFFPSVYLPITSWLFPIFIFVSLFSPLCLLVIHYPRIPCPHLSTVTTAAISDITSSPTACDMFSKAAYYSTKIKLPYLFPYHFLSKVGMRKRHCLSFFLNFFIIAWFVDLSSRK